MADPSGTSTANFARVILESVPRYLTTLWEFLTLRPRRFFLKYETEPERYLSPWPFLLVNALIAAALAVPAEMGSEDQSAWTWSNFGGWLAAALVANGIVVVYGAVAAWLLVQRVSAQSMMTAFCYASVFLPLHLPLSIYVLRRLEEEDQSRWGLVLFALTVQIIYLVAMLLSFARYNYIEGPYLRSFLIITLTLTLVTGIGGGVVLSILEQRDAQLPDAPVEWNISPRDYATLVVGNRTRNPGCSTCWANRVDAKVGEVISFEIYYHHSSTGVAQDARARLLLPTRIQGVGVIGAEVWSRDSARRATGAVSVNISPEIPIMLVFAGGEWYQGQDYKNQRQATKPLPINNPTEVSSEKGMALGDVRGGWENQGSIVVRFAVVDATAAQ